MLRYIFLAVVLFCAATNAAPQEKRDESASVEFTSAEWEELSDFEQLLVFLYLVDALGYEEDDFSRKARSAVMNKRDESGEMTSEEWEDLSDLEQLLVILFIQAMMESGDFDQEFLMRKARKADVPIEQMAKTILHN